MKSMALLVATLVCLGANSALANRASTSCTNNSGDSVDATGAAGPLRAFKLDGGKSVVVSFNDMKVAVSKSQIISIDNDKYHGGAESEYFVITLDPKQQGPDRLMIMKTKDPVFLCHYYRLLL